MSVRLAPTGVPLIEVHDGSAPSSPLRLGRYTLQGTLGEGAMGVVYRAHDPQLNRTVALKTFRKPPCGSAHASVAAALRLRNEAQAAARLSHPGIVAVYEYGEDGEQSFIAMEYVRGTPLLTGLAQPAALPIDDVLCLMEQLLVALQCAHEQGVWHRDIKPSNLMITSEGRLKIADFGIARMIPGIRGDAAAAPRDGGVMGSPGYLAPECYSSSAVVDQRADLYACGVLLFELLTGVRPFRGSPDVVMYKTLHLPVPPLAAPGDAQFVPLARFAHVVQRALAKSPDARYASALEMREALTMAAARAVPQTLSAPALRLLMPSAGRDGDTVASVPQAAPASAPAVSAAASPASAPAISPPSAPRSAPLAFSAALLAQLAAALEDELGPVAHCIVQRAATHGDPSQAALVMRVANDALPASRRGAFIERMRATIATPPRPSVRPPTGAVLPVLDDVMSEAPRLDPRLLRDAQRLLTEQVGPLAALLVRRAATGAVTRDQFITCLADLAAEGGEREVLFAALSRLG
jgi:eukaryotic-like serine/threonine-protein kinase